MNSSDTLHAGLLLIGQAVEKHRFDLTSEQHVQDEIENRFKAFNVPYKREYESGLPKEDRPDFFVADAIAVEVKIKYSKYAIYKQLERYAMLDKVKMVVLITSKAMGLPETINNKPIHYISISTAWL